MYTSVPVVHAAIYPVLFAPTQTSERTPELMMVFVDVHVAPLFVVKAAFAAPELSFHVAMKPALEPATCTAEATVPELLMFVGVLHVVPWLLVKVAYALLSDQLRHVAIKPAELLVTTDGE